MPDGIQGDLLSYTCGVSNLRELSGHVITADRFPVITSEYETVVFPRYALGSGACDLKPLKLPLNTERPHYALREAYRASCVDSLWGVAVPAGLYSLQRVSDFQISAYYRIPLQSPQFSGSDACPSQDQKNEVPSLVPRFLGSLEEGCKVVT